MLIWFLIDQKLIVSVKVCHFNTIKDSVQTCLVTYASHWPIAGIAKAAARHFLSSITVYPIKSCAGFSVDQWPLTSTGSYSSISHRRIQLFNLYDFVKIKRYCSFQLHIRNGSTFSLEDQNILNFNVSFLHSCPLSI